MRATFFSKFKVKANKAFFGIIMKPFVQRILLPFGHEIMPQRWIFILGCYNSGTTLLSNILRYHPAIDGLPNEGAFLTDALPYPERFGWPRMWSECIEKVSIPAENQPQMRAERIRRQWSLWLPRNPANVVEKSISNVARMNFLNEWFSPAYFIYIIRNGYAVAKGIQRKANLKRWNNPYKKQGYPIGLCANQWRVSDELFEMSKSSIERFLIVSYEKLTEYPGETLKKITKFLELENMPDELVEKEWRIHERSSAIKNMNSENLRYLTKAEIDEINAVAREQLIKCGYYIGD